MGEGDERELIRLERSLMEPGVRKSPERLRELLAHDFLEFGSSGRVFDREAIVRELRSESPKTVTATDFEVRFLTPDIALLTYRSHRIEEGTSFLRSSIWRHREGRWQIVFHQGTPASDAEPGARATPGELAWVTRAMGARIDVSDEEAVSAALDEPDESAVSDSFDDTR